MNQASALNLIGPDRLAGAEASDIQRLNADALSAEIDWFNRVLTCRFNLYFEQGENPFSDISEIPVPDLSMDKSMYAQTVRQFGFDERERLVLILALLPNIMPQTLDTFFIRNKLFDKPYSEFGGWQSGQHRGFMPTIETAAFLIAGGDIEKRFALTELFEPDHPFTAHNILLLDYKQVGEPFFCTTLGMSTEYLNLFTTGEVHKPDFSMTFPAKRLTTAASWDDLVLAHHVKDEVRHLISWAHGARTIMQDWGLAKVLKPGYRVLFYGPPGTGKTMTASLIGKEIQSDVYRVDLSAVVSKYIGETEKNLASLFDQAEKKKWILFFDEADALFGKRTQGSSANDRHSNQEISYLLQRIEDYPGIVILATNLQGNIDDAFSRRFQSMIHFAMPDAQQRYRIWKNSIPAQCPLADDVDLHALADNHELAGGAIINVIRYAAIQVVQTGSDHITQEFLDQGVVKEQRKEGKSL